VRAARLAPSAVPAGLVPVLTNEVLRVPPLLASRREALVSTETFVLRRRPELNRAAVAATTSSRP